MSTNEEHHQWELEQQERILTDPEYRKEFEQWLDKLEQDKLKDLDQHLNQLEEDQHANR